MEPVTHALSGAVLVQTLPASVRTPWMLLWGALVASSPDVDVFFIHNPVEYIEYHRGITHSLVGILPLALLSGAVLLFLLAAHRAFRRVPFDGAQGGWTLYGGFALAFVLLLHHLWLDCTNSYGTQIFLPFSDLRVRFSGLFIIDPLLLGPLLAGLLWKRQSRKVMSALLIWTLVYPAGAVAGRLLLEQRLASHNMEIDSGTVAAVHLTPDAFTPAYWKLIADMGAQWQVAGYTVGEGIRVPFRAYDKPPAELWDMLGKEDATFAAYQRFCQFPALEKKVTAPEGVEYVFTDLRFGSTLAWVDAIQSRRDGKDEAFRIMARFNALGKLVAVRFVTVAGAGGDSGWNPPQHPYIRPGNTP